MRTVGVILSSKYPDFEITQQYGLLPPSFLPISGQRLFISQINYLSRFCDRVFLTIPLDYELTLVDHETLKTMHVTLIRNSSDISINEALLEVLKMLPIDHKAISVLYGDTLIDEEIPIDSVTIYRKPDAYSWGRNKGVEKFESSLDQYVEMMMAGLFYLSDTGSFKNAISKSNGDILNALDMYSDLQPLKYQAVKTWNDFGHLGTLQQSRLAFPESRYFNSVEISELGVTKHSANVEKLSAEIAWYKNIPDVFQKFVPNLINQTTNSYTLEYIPSPTVHDLLIFGNLRSDQWMEFFDQLYDFFNEAKGVFDPKNQISLSFLLKEKTEARCKEFLSSNPSLKDFKNSQLASILSQQNIELLLNQIKLDCSKFLGIVHGDMCATNLFWDGATKSLKIVDPRGDSTVISNGVYGDIRYDVAKLYQSFILGYDYVLSGISWSTIGIENKSDITQLNHHVDFCEFFRTKLFEPLEMDEKEIAAIATLLMFGLLPLHADRIERQNEFMHIIVSMLIRLKI